MTITKKVTTTETVEIDLPYYSKKMNTYYKVTEGYVATATRIDDKLAGLMINTDPTEHFKSEALDATPCSEQEVQKAFARAAELMGNVLGRPVDVNALCTM